MNKMITAASVATILSLALAAPALAKVQPNAYGSPMGTSTTSTSGVKPGVHAGPVSHGKKVTKITLQGVIKATTLGSLTLTVRNSDYTVMATTSTRVINRVWKKISLSDISVGDKVRVYGALAGTNITAEIVRDMSAPMIKTSTSTTGTASTTTH